MNKENLEIILSALAETLDRKELDITILKIENDRLKEQIKLLEEKANDEEES